MMTTEESAELKRQHKEAIAAMENSPLWGTFVRAGVSDQEAQQMARAEFKKREARVDEIGAILFAKKPANLEAVASKMRDAGFEDSGNAARLTNRHFQVRGENF